MNASVVAAFQTAVRHRTLVLVASFTWAIETPKSPFPLGIVAIR
jgi:hypothetical protein